MTEIDVAGEYEGIRGKFKYRGSFPLTLESCHHMIDRIKMKNTMCYVDIHGSHDGTVHMTTNTVNTQ